MNVSRRTEGGIVDDKESLNKSQIYVTTAGHKGSFAYEKLLQLLIWQIVRPEDAFVFGGTYRVPVMHKLLDRNFVRDLKMDGERKVSAVRNFASTHWGLAV